MSIKPINKQLAKVTICVPVRNGARTIQRTLDSLLNQDYPNYEIIVSDNCSDDDTANIVTSVRMVKAILCDAIDQWLLANRSQLDTNGDTDVVGATAFRPGDGYGRFDFTYGDKTAQVELTDDTGIDNSGDLTVEIPYSDSI